MLPCFSADAVIGFDGVPKTIAENAGSLEVSVRVLSGSVEREVVVGLSALSGSATGE